MLTPATAEDLRMAGKITVNSTEGSDVDGNKAVQVKVPVVATVMQNIEPDGRSSFIIEPPGAEQEQGKLSFVDLARRDEGEQNALLFLICRQMIW